MIHQGFAAHASKRLHETKMGILKALAEFGTMLSARAWSSFEPQRQAHASMRATARCALSPPLRNARLAPSACCGRSMTRPRSSELSCRNRGVQHLTQHPVNAAGNMSTTFKFTRSLSTGSHMPSCIRAYWFMASHRDKESRSAQVRPECAAPGFLRAGRCSSANISCFLRINGMKKKRNSCRFCDKYSRT